MEPTKDNVRPTTRDRDDAECQDGDAQADGVAISLKRGAVRRGNPGGGVAVWNQRLTSGAKLRRAAVAVLAVLLALAVIFGGRFPLLPALVAGVSSALSVRQSAMPIATARVLTPHPPVPLAAGPWQQIGLPTPHDTLWSFAPVPSDPSTVYACTNSASVKDNPTILWRSRDAGIHWQQLPLVFGNDTVCLVQIADDGMGHVSVLVESGAAEGFMGNGCEPSALYLSRDNGASWRALDPGAPFLLVETQSLCSLILTPHHLYAYHRDSHTTNAATPTPLFQSILLRSDDGRTWTAADASIGAANYFGVQIVPERDDDTLIATVRYQHGDKYGTALWRSSDAGRQWHYVGNVENFTDLMVSQEPVTTRSAVASHMLYGLTGNYAPEGLYWLRVIESSDGQQWERLPQLPVPGASQDRVGVRETLGVAAGGKLLFLGADPHAGVPAPDAVSYEVSGEDQWLWAWDPRAQRWEVPQAPLRPTKGASHCADHCWDPHLAWGPGQDGTGYGTYVWVVHWGDTSKGDDTSLYRIFIPAS